MGKAKQSNTKDFIGSSIGESDLDWDQPPSYNVATSSSELHTHTTVDGTFPPHSLLQEYSDFA